MLPLFELGLRLIEAKKFEEARSTFEAVLEQEGATPATIAALALVMNELGFFEKAQQLSGLLASLDDVFTARAREAIGDRLRRAPLEKEAARWMPRGPRR